MMERSVTYTCTALNGSNKSGSLKPDANGYYEVVLGGFNVENRGGQYYPLGPVKSLFETSSGLMRRITEGNCKAECGHPKPQPGMSKREWLSRVGRIEETNVCAHIAEVTIRQITGPDGRPMTAAVGKVRPTGPMGEGLARAFESDQENVCFSIRSFTNDKMVGGRLEKSILDIVTWDWVVEPGIKAAQKWYSPGLESVGSLESFSFDPQVLDRVIDSPELKAVGMESSQQYFEDLKRQIGWDNPQGKTPVSSRW